MGKKEFSYTLVGLLTDAIYLESNMAMLNALKMWPPFDQLVFPTNYNFVYIAKVITRVPGRGLKIEAEAEEEEGEEGGEEEEEEEEGGGGGERYSFPFPIFLERYK